MRLVIQRTDEASVWVAEEQVAAIGRGLLVLVGVEEADEEEDAAWLAKKVAQMRIFEDEDGKMNWSLQDIEGEVLLVSQFTLHAKTKKGNRPSFARAAHPEKAAILYDLLEKTLTAQYQISCKKGVFGAHMDVRFNNNGPVTIFIDTKNKA